MPVLDKRTRDDPRRHATELAFRRATEELLNEGASFADLNVSRIANRADRTRTAFYQHFEDRRELLLATFGGAGEEALAAIEPFLAGQGPVTRDELIESIKRLLSTYREHRTLLRAVVEAAGYDEAIAKYWNAIVTRFIVATSERLQAQGMSASDSNARARALVWMTERTCYQQAVQDQSGADDLATIIGLSDVWWSVLLASGAQRTTEN